MIHAFAPASTANLGPGFDSAAVALDLWNEMTVEPATDCTVEIDGIDADELPRDRTHLAVRAFALFACAERYRFRFVNRIPLERGLGSSAAAIALGLVAGAAVVGAARGAGELLAAGARLEGHIDNLAAALKGGVCVAGTRDAGPAAARIARDMPLAPVVVVPPTRTNTRHSRNGLPFTVSHTDAATTVASAALLGAAIASGSATLLADAFHDRLHEQYRISSSPLLQLFQDDLPSGAGGVTLSGSGPSVVVWAKRDQLPAVVSAIRRAVPADTTVLPLRVAQEGAATTA
jgi:homoserine kinase